VTGDVRSGPTASGARSIGMGTNSGAVISGDNATAIVNVGLSYPEVKEVALDVFRDNFVKLKGDAFAVAMTRAEELTEQLLRAIQGLNPVIMRTLADPGAQRAVFRAQEEFACSGDPDLGDVLVDVLLARLQEPNRSFRRLVLDETLTTVAKLTNPQIATMSFVFYAGRVKHIGLSFDEALSFLHEAAVQHLVALGKMATSPIELRHLEYCGCLTSDPLAGSISSSYKENYPYLFTEGVNPHSVPSDVEQAFSPHPGRPGRLFIPVVDDDGLDAHLARFSLNDRQRDKVRSLLPQSPMSDQAVMSLVARDNERLQQLFTIWQESGLGGVDLTSVGTAIAHANLRRAAPSFGASLDTWLSERVG
jgi:hypothetical protein